MNLVHLTASRFFGGPERQMLGLAQHLPPQFRTVFVSFSEGGLCQAFLDEVRRAGFEGLALQHDTPHLLAALRELTALLHRLKPDVVVPHGYKSNLLGFPAARRLGIPTLAVSHGWTAECRRVRLYEALDRLVLHRMDKVVCVSEAQARKVRLAGVQEAKVHVIRDAVRADRFGSPDTAYRQRLFELFPRTPHTPFAVGQSIPHPPCADAWQTDHASVVPGAGCKRPFMIGAAGRLSPEKGFNVLIDAASRLLWPRPSPLAPRPSLRFVLFGDGPLRDTLSRQITALGLEDRFILAGFRQDLDRYLPHLDLFVQSSFTEGLPNVVLEAQAAGVPVVATAVGGTAEIIEDGVSGLLVPSGEPSALAERITSIAGDDIRRKAMAERGRLTVKEKFSFSSQADDYVKLLESILAPATRVPVTATSAEYGKSL